MEYIRFEFINVEPLRIADDSTSQSGQTDTLAFIPGSSICGALIGELLRIKNANQEYINTFLSERIRFLNAYPVYGSGENKHELLPSIRGFYENKADAGTELKEVESVLKNGSVTPGYKRASLGMYGYPDGESYYFTSLERSADLKINLGKEEGSNRTVFRSQYLSAGYRFAAYIGTADEEIQKEITGLLESLKYNDRLVIGNARSSGLGKCRITDIRLQKERPYGEYALDEDNGGCVYMMLLSDLAMLDNNGENAGININALQEYMGVKNLKIAYCSTGVVNVCGYNRTWGTKIPSVRMYQKGSLFKLTFKGIFSKDKMAAICDAGLGMRKNEGFGRVLFLKDYEMLRFKQKIAEELRAKDRTDKTVLSDEEKAVLKIAARGIYRNALRQAEELYLSNPAPWKGSVRSSQLGMLRSIASRYRFSPEQGITEISKYIDHQKDKVKKKNYHKDTGDRSRLDGSIGDILNNDIGVEIKLDITSVCGYGIHELFSKEELDRMKINLLIRRIDRENREGKSNE